MASPPSGSCRKSTSAKSSNPYMRPLLFPGVKVLVNEEELRKIEKEHGRLKRVGKGEVKWLLPPDWSETTFDGVFVELPDDLAPRVFRKFKVKALRKR